MKSKVAASKSSDRSFGIVFTVFFALIAFWPLLNGGALNVWFGTAAAACLVMAVLRPGWLAPFNRGWNRLGLFMGSIVNPVVLGLIFVVTVLPIGLIYKILGKDPLRLRKDPSACTYWIKREPPGPSPATLPRQF